MRSTSSESVFLDAGLFIAALLRDDPRHREARGIVEAARAGVVEACTDSSVLSEVYAALTWEQTRPRHSPDQAAYAVRLLVEAPSAITVLPDEHESALLALKIAASHGLTARRIHDARHAAVALVAGVRAVYTYDLHDWRVFAAEGMRITGPASVVAGPR
jgi:predicted nucleic acid-binding protein